MRAAEPQSAARLLALIRTTSARELRQSVHLGALPRQLSSAEEAEILAIIEAWEQRALGELPLRDALLVDRERGARLYALLAPLYAADPALPSDPQLEALLPEPPQPIAASQPAFDPPVGLRRALAALCALIGALLILLPLLAGRIPDRPAFWPLGLFTLALLVGVRAGWRGFIGSGLIWLVANLPTFRHGQIHALWQSLPLLFGGLILIGLDHRLRVMWAWIRSQVWRR